MDVVHTDKILVLDFGSYSTQLLARQVRELGVYCEVWSWQHDPNEIANFGAKGIILCGGDDVDYRAVAADFPQILLAQSVPVLAVGSASASLGLALGGKVSHVQHARHYALTSSHPLFSQYTDDAADIAHADGWQWNTLPKGFEAIAKSADEQTFLAAANAQKQCFMLAFHPENMTAGKAILAAFVQDICACGNDWISANIVQRQIAHVRASVGSDNVLLALSGGVDSSVVAALLHKAIGSQLTCVFVDTGLMRWQEGDEVMASIADHMGVNVIRVNAAERYFAALDGVSDPEQKRKIIGQMFITIFEEEAAKLKAQGTTIKWLAQGTIYPDVIESADTGSGAIKSHHNVGGLPERMQLQLIEPLRPLFKDEVRRIGLLLGLPEKLVYRHPFPGPGLGVRILGQVKPDYAHILARADAIFIEELRAAGWYDKVSQAFAVFIPAKSVGVVNDKRTYEWVIALRAVETIDFMTARWAHLPYALLEKVSNRIINELEHISRVVYDISGKPPATIEWE